MTIGELAAASGVPAKTIRYYADLGVLPEAARSPGGYRLFDREDLARLELVRALRALDFDLATIKGLLAEPRGMTQVVNLHLEAVEVQLRDLQRTRAVLRAARDAGADEGAAYLRRLQVLATMSAAERTALVRDFFAGTAEGVPVDRDWLAELTEAGLPELPDEPTAAQLDAWLELAGLVTDETFRRNVRANAAGFWSEVEGVDVREFGKRAADVAAEAARPQRPAPTRRRRRAAASPTPSWTCTPARWAARRPTSGCGSASSTPATTQGPRATGSCSRPSAASRRRTRTPSRGRTSSWAPP